VTDPRDQYLQAFHARHPGATADVFERGVTGDGTTSYELLADLVQPGQRVLDLGCGDGPLLALLRRRGHPAAALVGVDASAAELDRARRRPEIDGVDLRCERGERTSLAASSVDVVASHLAFMLFSEPHQTLDEVARVLRPGGVFATVVGGGPVEPVPGAGAEPPDALALFAHLARDDFAALKDPPPRLGDPRCRTAAGLQELLPPSFCSGVSERRVELVCDGTFDQVWYAVSMTYEAASLAAQRLGELQQAVARRAAQNNDGSYRCRLVVRLLVANRA